jgi:hypothetical protein
MVIPIHPLLRPIAKDILLRWHNRSTSILFIGKFDKPCCQELSATSLDANPLGNAKSVRSPKNGMVVLQLNVDGFSFITFKILKAKKNNYGTSE